MVGRERNNTINQERADKDRKALESLKEPKKDKAVQYIDQAFLGYSQEIIASCPEIHGYISLPKTKNSMI